MKFYSSKDYLECKSPSAELQRLADEAGLPLTSEEFSKYLDSCDQLSFLRNEFRIPEVDSWLGADVSLVKADAQCIYMCGNSLGLQPKTTTHVVSQVMTDMAHIDVLQPTDGSGMSVEHDGIISQMARIVGAHPREISLTSGLTVNLHLLLMSFYLPTTQRHKILIESKAFPSDHYAAESQILFHGFIPKTSLMIMTPRPSEDIIHVEDILERIEKEGESISLILLPGIQYYTGQLFDMKKITKAAHKKGCLIVFDLAHAVGNAELHLHEWDVDCAVWCTYKYLNCGPGCIGGIFMHERHENNKFPKCLGPEGRGESTINFSSGIHDYEISSPCPILLSSVKCSMEIFSKTSIRELRNKSFYLTGLLECLLEHHFPKTGGNYTSISIITPKIFKERGAQLSLVFSVPVTQIYQEMSKRGVICDFRKPDVVRIAPAPLYCKFHDMYRFVEVLMESFEHCRTTSKMKLDEFCG